MTWKGAAVSLISLGAGARLEPGRAGAGGFSGGASLVAGQAAQDSCSCQPPGDVSSLSSGAPFLAEAQARRRRRQRRQDVSAAGLRRDI